MPKNKIQFQRGLSLNAFLSSYGTEQRCWEALFHLRWPNGFICPGCGHKEYGTIATRKLLQCKQCHRQTSVISGTLFASTNLPLTIWCLGIYLITQSKDGISSLNLARHLGISANAALRMKHKLQQAMKNIDESSPLPGFIVQLDDAYWGGKKHDGRRGRGATGKTPFLAAVSTNLKGHPIAMRLSRVKDFTSTEINRWASKHLSGYSLVATDALGCFAGVGYAGFAHEAILASGDSMADARRVFKWVNTMIGNVKNDLRGTYHAVSRKHLPRYLAEFCYRFNRRFNLGIMIRHLAQAALHSLPIPQHLLSRAENWW